MNSSCFTVEGVRMYFGKRMHEVITLIVLRRPILGQTICTTRHGKRNFSDKSHPKKYFSGNYKVLKNDILVDNQSVRVV